MPDIGKIHNILQVLQKYSQVGASNKEISEELHLPPSTCSRILSALRKYDFVYKRPSDSRYFLGFAHLRFAQSLLATSDEVSLCRPYIDELHRKLQETVFYAKYSGTHCVVIDVRGAINTRISVGLGELMPLHSSASGKVVLAFVPKYERMKLYKKIPLDRYTNQTPVDVDLLEQQIEEIQRSHLCYNYSEFHEGINAVAAPVFNRFGSVVGALAIVGTSARLTDEVMREKGKVLLSTSKEISERLIRGDFP